MQEEGKLCGSSHCIATRREEEWGSSITSEALRQQLIINTKFIKIKTHYQSTTISTSFSPSIQSHNYFSPSPTPFNFSSSSFNPEFPQSFHPTPFTVVYASVAGKSADPNHELPAAGPANLATATGT